MRRIGSIASHYKEPFVKAIAHYRFIPAILIGLCVSRFSPGHLQAAPGYPAAADYVDHRGKTFYVSEASKT